MRYVLLLTILGLAMGFMVRPPLADTMAYDDRGNPIQALGISTAQKVSYTDTAGTIANVVGSKDDGSIVAWVVCTTDCFIVSGAAPTATASSTFLPARVVMFIKLSGGKDKISAIRLNTNGTLHVTLMD